MKIAFINQPICVMGLPNPQGSVPIWLFEVANRLAKDMDVVVFSRKEKHQPRIMEYNGVEYHNITLDDHIIKIARQIQQMKCDIVHIQNMLHYVPILKIFNPKIKIVLHLHGQWLRKLYQPFVKKWLLQTEVVLGCSDYITHSIKRLYSPYIKHCCTIYNGVDVNLFSPIKHGYNQNTKNLLFVGRISPEKGLHVLIDAFRQVLQKHPDAHLTLLGPELVYRKEFLKNLTHEPHYHAIKKFYNRRLYPYYPDYLKNMLVKNLERKVSMMGYVIYRELPCFYNKANVVINPSLSETFGMSLVEAMACEVPVVATSVGGMKEIVTNKKNGFFVPPNNPKALATAIATLLNDRKLCKSMGAVGRETAITYYSWDKICNQLIKIYRQIIKI